MVNKIAGALGFITGIVFGIILCLPILATYLITIALGLITFFPMVLMSWLMRAIGANGRTVKLLADAWADVVLWPSRQGVKAGDAIFGTDESEAFEK